MRLTRAFVVLVFVADVRGIVFDGRIGKSLLSSVSSIFVVPAVKAMEKLTWRCICGQQRQQW